MKRVKRVLHRVNAPRMIAQHLFGKEHTRGHQCIIGAFVMVGGIWIGILLKHAIQAETAHVFIEAFAAAIHGIGLTPYIEWVIEITEGA